jgi:hypothetical protein
LILPGIVRINLVVEGDSEETLANDFLAPELAAHGRMLAARRVYTSRHGGRWYRGGMTSFERARRDIKRWLAQDRGAYVTTMFDLFRLPQDFPRWEEAKAARADPLKRVTILEEGLAETVGHPHFIPYIQAHEFEALLFSDVATTDLLLTTVDPSRLAEMQAIRSEFATPEHVNDGASTAPSKRLEALYPSYDKATYGPLIAAQIGVDTLCRECRHFGEWISRLQTLPPLRVPGR